MPDPGLFRSMLTFVRQHGGGCHLGFTPARQMKARSGRWHSPWAKARGPCAGPRREMPGPLPVSTYQDDAEAPEKACASCHGRPSMRRHSGSPGRNSDVHRPGNAGVMYADLKLRQSACSRWWKEFAFASRNSADGRPPAAVTDGDRLFLVGAIKGWPEVFLSGRSSAALPFDELFRAPRPVSHRSVV